MATFFERPIRLLTILFVMPARRQLKELYLFLFFFSFASALVTIFEPIFFYQQGIPVARIALYYALHYVLYIFIMPLGGKFAARFGYERSLAVSTPILAAHFLILAALATAPWLFWLAIVTLTVHKTFFWPAFHANFATFSTKENRGTEQSWVRFIIFSSGIAGPLIGGFVAGSFGFSALFILASLTLAIAVIPILRTKDKGHIVPPTFRGVWGFLLAKKQRRLLIGMIGWGEDLMYLAFWPLFMFIILGDTERLGVIIAIAGVVMIFWGFIIGALTDRFTARRVLKFAAPAVALANIFRLFAATPLAALGTEMYGRLSGISVDIPFTARLYKSARGAGPLNYSIAFETALAIAKGAVAFALVAIFATTSVSTGFNLTFALAAILALFYMAI